MSGDITLNKALNQHVTLLGPKCENLGKNQGILAGRVYAVYDSQKGWDFRTLNFIEILARWIFGLFGLYPETHLKTIVAEVKRLQGQSRNFGDIAGEFIENLGQVIQGKRESKFDIIDSVPKPFFDRIAHVYNKTYAGRKY